MERSNFENRYKKDEIMESFQKKMNDLMNNFYEKTSSLQTTDLQEKIHERQRRREEEYKQQQERKLERQIRHAETNRLLYNINKKEKDIVENYSNILGLDNDPNIAQNSVEKKLRIVALKRKFPNKILKPLKYRQTQVYTFPHDIWYVISQFLETLSILKLEKSCMSLYITFNKQCDKCDNKNFYLNSQCKHIWRQQYNLNNCPFINNEEYTNISCRVMKALVSRQILQDIMTDRLLKLRQNMCFKGTHALKIIKKKTDNFVCDLCDSTVLKANHCGNICMKHKKHSLFICLYPVPQSGKQVPHKCYCICCMTYMSENETMRQLRKDIGFYLGLKQYTVFINFNDSQKYNVKLKCFPPVKVAFINEY